MNNNYEVRPGACMFFKRIAIGTTVVTTRYPNILFPRRTTAPK